MSAARDPRPATRLVPFDSLPTAAMLIRDEVCVAVNAAYERLMGAPAATVVGRTVNDLIGQFVATDHVPLVDAASEARRSAQQAGGQLWIVGLDANGRPRPLRVDWGPTGVDGEAFVYLVDAEGETAARTAADALARAAGQLGTCQDEREVLERAADVLHARGLIVTVLLLRDGDPLLDYGPMRAAPRAAGDERPGAGAALRAVRPRREILWELNKDFDQRRAAFFQDVGPLVVAAYGEPLGGRVQAQIAQRRTVQAPLFVNDAPYGAFVLTGDLLSPALVGSIELFVELVARAIENVRLRTELVQRERLAALGEAAAVMAHEVRNPVAAILNAGSLLERESLDRAAQSSLVRIIAEESRRLDRMVGDLLDLGRPLVPRIRTADLYELARRSVDVLTGRGEASQVSVTVARPEAPVSAALDPELAQLAVLNVVRNAVQACPPGRRVTVWVEPRADGGALVVDDEGPGFPPGDVEKLLEPFATRRATGTGIGLAVVRRVVDACKGRVAIARSPSGGARFVMSFPPGE